MVDYTKSNVGSGYNTNSAINTENTKIATAIASKMDKSGTTMTGDLDMNSNDILNAKAIDSQSLSLAGELVTVSNLATTTLPAQAGNGGKYLTTNGTTPSWDSLNIGEVNIDDYVTDPLTASAGINLAAAEAVSSGRALVSHDRSITYVLQAGVPIDLSSIKYINIKSKIDTTNLDGVTTTGCIILGELALNGGGDWRFNDIVSSNPTGSRDATTYPQIRIQGAKGIRMQFTNLRFLQFYMDYTGGAGAYTRSGNAYNEIFFNNRINRFEVDSDTVIVDPLWFNENMIYGGRIYKTIFKDNGYIHNHNHFHHPLFENDTFELDIQTGHSNHWHGVRLESVTGSSGITFGANAKLNTISRTWISGIDPREMVQNPMFATPFTDNGVGNSIRYAWMEDINKHEVISFSPSITILGSGTGILDLATSNVKGVLDNDYEPTAFNKPAAIPCIHSVVFPNAFSSIAESELLPTHLGAVYSFEAGIRAGNLRYEVTIFDSNGVALDNSTAFSATSLVYISNGLYQATSNLSTTDSGSTSNHPLGMSVLSSDVAYVRFRAMTGDASNTVVDFVTISYYEPPEGHGASYASIGTREKKLWLDTAPTTGHAPVGTVVGTPTGDHECIFELSTKVTTEISAGATSITVDQITNGRPAGDILNGYTVGIALDDGTAHWDTVSGLAGNTFTIGALTSPIGTAGVKALAGASVVFNQWKRYSIRAENNSIAVGKDAMRDSVFANGDHSAVLGANAGLNMEGSYNTLVGATAGQDITGDNNTVVGGNGAIDITSGSNNTLLGYLNAAGVGTATNRIILGVGVTGTADDQFSFGKLSNVVSNDFGTDALWSRISDERYKENIDDYSLGLDFISRLRVRSYNWRDGYGDTTYKVNGLVAQEVEEALEGVPFNGHVVLDNEEKTQKLKLEAFILPLINAIQELEDRVQELESKS